MAETVATPLEEQINGVENMLYMSSSSTGDGSLTITVTFAPGSDINEDQVLVQNRVATATPRLPDQVRLIGVVVSKSSPDLLLVATLVSPNHSLPQQYLSNYATLQLVDRLSRVRGVGNVRVFGARDYSMRIWIDPDRAEQLNLTVDEIVAAIRAQNAQVTAGAVGQPPFNRGGTAFQLGIQAKGRLKSPEEFRDIIRHSHAAPLCRHRSRARRAAGCPGGKRVFHARHLFGLDLHQRFQSSGPHLAGHRAGRRAASRRNRRHRQAEDAVLFRRDGAARCDDDAQERQRTVARGSL
jgi:HAE1 family hydrophobic/amphiphilic exporter-1